MGRVELGTANEVRKLTTALSEAVRDFVAKKRGACTDDEMMEWTAEQLSGLLRHMDGALCNTTAVGGSAQGPGDSPTRKRQRTAADAPTAEDAQLEREVVGLADRVVALRETVPAVLAVHVSEQLLAVRPAADGIASLAGEVEAADSARAGAAGAPAARELGDKFGALVRLLPGLRARLEGAVNRIERVVAAVEEEGARDGGPAVPEPFVHPASLATPVAGTVMPDPQALITPPRPKAGPTAAEKEGVVSPAFKQAMEAGMITVRGKDRHEAAPVHMDAGGDAAAPPQPGAALLAREDAPPPPKSPRGLLTPRSARRRGARDMR